MGAIPAPPPIKTISLSVSRAKNSPNGPEMVTLSPGFWAKMNDDIWPGVSALKDHKTSFPKWKPKPLEEILDCICDDGMDLLKKMFGTCRGAPTVGAEPWSGRSPEKP